MTPDQIPTYADLRTYILGPAILLQPVHIGEHEVPAGFPTDLASTPRLVWWIIPPWGRYLLAAIVHDYYYVSQCITRREADAAFLDLMRLYGVPAWKRGVMWAAVRAFGWIAWRRNRRATGGQGWPVSGDEE